MNQQPEDHVLSPTTLPEKVEIQALTSGCLDASSAATALSNSRSSIGQLLAALLPAAQLKARSPVSGYCVGAVAMAQPSSDSTSIGNIYLGANFEFPGLPLAMTIHAEQAAVNAAWLAGERGISMLAVTAPPCGYCRQFLAELSTADEVQVLVASDEANDGTVVSTLNNLLPHRFGPTQLGHSGGLMTLRSANLQLPANAALTGAATAACHSYAPYTGNYAGVEVQTTDGRRVLGRTIETAAFNPGLTAMQSAISALAMQTPAKQRLQIDQARLVEVPTTASQRAVSELLVRSISPDAALVVSETSPASSST